MKFYSQMEGSLISMALTFNLKSNITDVYYVT